MRRLIPLLLILAPALASAQVTGRVAGQTFMVADKVIAGVTGGFAVGRFRMDGEFHLGYVTSEESQQSLNGDTFFGLVMGVHAGGRIYQDPRLGVDIGTGVDIWSLVAIHEEEYKLAMPVQVEVSYRLAGPLTARLGLRYYLVSSDGLMVGRKWEGGDGLPLFATVGLGGEWR